MVVGSVGYGGGGGGFGLGGGGGGLLILGGRGGGRGGGGKGGYGSGYGGGSGGGYSVGSGIGGGALLVLGTGGGGGGGKKGREMDTCCKCYQGSVILTVVTVEVVELDSLVVAGIGGSDVIVWRCGCGLDMVGSVMM
ncbi:Hypothetical predicted protein [Mytilus galloprovincialis]|uniref:Uncharacterized protein n=1 Tax=Mytilus galloprovincialis TaxID=29158 RepID=A0A8B6EZH7_MYTGA|nr:Hypothetical predicted protein [Mytilus galloprovincialis]